METSKMSLKSLKSFYNFGPQTTELKRKYLSSIQIFEIIDKESFA